MLGYASVDDILGKNMYELVHHSYPDGRPMPVESCHIYQAFSEGKGTHQDDEVLWRPDGSPFSSKPPSSRRRPKPRVDPEEFVSTIQHLYSHPSEKSSDELHLVDERCFTRYSAPLMGEGGKNFGRIWYFRDISAPKRAEQALKASEARYRLLAENATDVIWTMGADMRFSYISPSVERLRGYSAEEAMRQTLEESVTPESMIRVRAELSRAFALLREGRRFPEFRREFEQPCKNGSSVWVQITVAGLYDEAGIFGGILGVSRDVTERSRSLT